MYAFFVLDRKDIVVMVVDPSPVREHAAYNYFYYLPWTQKVGKYLIVLWMK